MKKLLLIINLLFVCFALQAQATITSFSPTSGPIGTTVTISGTGFNATAGNNVVFFGATQATVTNATSSSLTVTVPVGATYQNISVTDVTTGLTAYSAKPFIVTFDNGGNFAFPVSFTSTSNLKSGLIGDLDGDGKSDLVSINSTTLSVFRNTGSADTLSFATKEDYVFGTSGTKVAIGDLDGDGKPDLVVVNSVYLVSVYRNTSSSGSISFAAKVDLTTVNGAKDVAIGDMNGDGKPDLIVANGGSNSVSFLRNTGNKGTISFATKVDFPTGYITNKVAIGDLDGDGKPDLAVAASNESWVLLFRNTGSSGSLSFAPKIHCSTGSFPTCIAIGDLDGDGKPDLAVSNNSSSSVSVLLNTGSSGTISFAVKEDFTLGGLAIS